MMKLTVLLMQIMVLISFAHAVELRANSRRLDNGLLITENIYIPEADVSSPHLTDAVEGVSGVPTEMPTEFPWNSFSPTELPTEMPTEFTVTTSAPTVVPTVAPSLGPGQTDAPTMPPTPSPTETPSTTPTTAPTFNPANSVPPSAIPTFAPTAVPSWSMAPSATPTAAPTVAPTTSQPSAAPTEAPTFMPTALPTFAPTFTPTATPTATPTQVPTAQPTKQTSPVLQFSSNLTLAGLTSPTLDTLSQQVVVNTTAISMAIASKYVSFAGQTAVPSVSVSIVKLEKKIKPDATYSVIATTLTKIPTSNPDSLYTSLTTALDNAVSSGQFSVTLQQVGDAAGDTQTANAQCTGVSNSAPIISYPPSSSNSSNGLSGGAIAGIVIGVLAGVALIGAAIYYYLFVMEKGEEKPLVDRALPSNTTKKDVEVLL